MWIPGTKNFKIAFLQIKNFLYLDKHLLYVKNEMDTWSLIVTKYKNSQELLHPALIGS